MRAEAQASKVDLGPRLPAGHGDAINHVRRDILSQLPLRCPLIELVLRNWLCLNRLQWLVQVGEVKQGSLRLSLATFLHFLLRNWSQGIFLPVGQCAIRLTTFATTRLRPTLLEVGELIGTSPAELLKELIESHNISFACGPAWRRQDLRCLDVTQGQQGFCLAPSFRRGRGTRAHRAAHIFIWGPKLARHLHWHLRGSFGLKVLRAGSQSFGGPWPS
mmetsp:Transcript_27952/g.65030  ORF Transcript_27952/g.65030 Transcript_27952/m.65030 type:complete len:218 (-) Transcript_27952:860-1513(-)